MHISQLLAPGWWWWFWFLPVPFDSAGRCKAHPPRVPFWARRRHRGPPRSGRQCGSPQQCVCGLCEASAQLMFHFCVSKFRMTTQLGTTPLIMLAGKRDKGISGCIQAVMRFKADVNGSDNVRAHKFLREHAKTVAFTFRRSSCRRTGTLRCIVQPGTRTFSLQNTSFREELTRSAGTGYARTGILLWSFTMEALSREMHSEAKALNFKADGIRPRCVVH